MNSVLSSISQTWISNVPLSLVIPFAQQRFPVQWRRPKYKIICYESFSSIWICWAFLKGCISARLAVKQICRANPVLSLVPLILAMEFVCGNGPDFWQRMIPPGYVRKSYTAFSRFWNSLPSLLPHLHTLRLIGLYLRFPIPRYQIPTHRFPVLGQCTLPNRMLRMGVAGIVYTALGS